MKTLKLLVCLALALASGPFVPPIARAAEKDAAAADAGNKDLVKTAEQLAAQIGEQPQVKELFDRSFFKYLSLEKTEEILRQLYRTNGRVTAVRLEYADSRYSAHFTFETDKNFALPAALSLSKDTGRITGLFFKSPYQKNLSLSAVKERLAALPGRAGFLAIKLNAPGMTLETLNERAYFAVGSAFKLYLLGTVVEEGYSWKKVFTLGKDSKSLPSGRLQNWPDGSPLTIHTLATAMISESDNTASDTLADGLGRKTIEGALPALGHSNPELLKPFLKTSEMFRLKSDTEESVKYLNAPLEEKYKLLDALKRKPLSAAELKTGPFGIDKIEWPASPAGLCRLMEYFYKEKDSDGTALAIMAVNPGLDIPKNKFLYAGYKGGSEAGVLNMTWLLETAGGDWYCLTGSWNNEKDNLEEKQFFELMQAAINSLGGQAGERK